MLNDVWFFEIPQFSFTTIYDLIHFVLQQCNWTSIILYIKAFSIGSLNAKGIKWTLLNFLENCSKAVTKSWRCEKLQDFSSTMKSDTKTTTIRKLLWFKSVKQNFIMKKTNFPIGFGKLNTKIYEIYIIFARLHSGEINNLFQKYHLWYLCEF